MNIVYVTHCSVKGGANSELLLLVKDMIEKGNTVYVILPCSGWLTDELDRISCHYVISSFHRWVEPAERKILVISKLAKCIINWKSAMKLKSFFDDKKIDIVHTNDSITVVGAYLAWLLHVPHVWHIREIFDSDLGFQHTFSEKYCEHWLQKASAVVAISKVVYNRYQRYEISNLITIYDGVDTQKCCFSDSIRSSDTIKMLFCGGTSRQKGFEDVINLAIMLRQDNFSFLIDIAGSYNLDSYTKEVIQKNNIDNNLRFHGFVSDLAKLRSENDIALMCSRDEAFGLVTIEAMLSGCVVVGKNSGGTPEILEDGRTGFLYDTVPELYAIIKQLRAYDLSAIRNAAYDFAIRNYTITETGRKVQELYTELVK